MINFDRYTARGWTVETPPLSDDVADNFYTVAACKYRLGGMAAERGLRELSVVGLSTEQGLRTGEMFGTILYEEEFEPDSVQLNSLLRAHTTPPTPQEVLEQQVIESKNRFLGQNALGDVAIADLRLEDGRVSAFFAGIATPNLGTIQFYDMNQL